MKAEQFQKQLYKAQELMSQEKFDLAQKILYELREIEQNGDFEYSLTHKLYQLISNLESLKNQKIIAEVLNNLTKSEDKIAIKDLEQILTNEKELKLEYEILKREIELLILRGIVKVRIDGETIIF